MTEQTGDWALILGASSGFGAAIARELAGAGYNIFGVHLDRRATMPVVEQLMADIHAAGVEARFFNGNAADLEFRAIVVAEMTSLLKQRDELGHLRLLVHSLAFGALRLLISSGESQITPQQLSMTFEVMAHSLVFWTQDIIGNGLMTDGGRIFAMTSAGGHCVCPAYGAISAAKAALEAYIRQLAVELAPSNITANAIQAGVTDTPALRKIPSCQAMIDYAVGKNPHGRLTTPEDVARALLALASPGTAWMTGNVIRVDGGEDIIG
jgi:enoyl-[acyl-carrier protein] reductase III